MFAASNEPPEDESLLAMHDRFLFRIEVEYVHDAANKKRMFNNYIYDRAGVSMNKTRTTITVEELEALQAKAKTIPVPKAIINKFISLMSSLQKNATISISDRRANECFKVLQGSALLHGRDKVGLDDFNSLKYVLWEKKEQIDTIGAEITKIVNPYDEEFTKFTRQFNEVKDKIESSSDVKDRNQAYFQYQNSIKNTIGRMNKLIAEASANGKDVSDFIKFRDDIVSYHTNLANEILGGTLGNSFNSVRRGDDVDDDIDSEDND
jgi:MoxR-like ATPase